MHVRDYHAKIGAISLEVYKSSAKIVFLFLVFLFFLRSITRTKTIPGHSFKHSFKTRLGRPVEPVRPWTGG